MTTHTYSLREYAAVLLGPGPDGTANTVEPSKCAWLVRRLRDGRLPGYKASNQWRATEADIDIAIERLRPKAATIPDIPDMSGLSARSAKRLIA
jgi:hypothetical protein